MIQAKDIGMCQATLTAFAESVEFGSMIQTIGYRQLLSLMPEATRPGRVDGWGSGVGEV